MTQRADIERLVAEAVAATIRQYAAAFYLDCAGCGDGLVERAADKLGEYAAQAAADALSGLIKREEELREALRQVALEAHETIPPDGKEAAFAALGVIARIAVAALNPKTEGE